MKILETERLSIREVEADRDAEFMLQLLNSPKFIQYIGDRNVRSVNESHDFIRDRYRKSYEVNGYGLYAVELKPDVNDSIGEQIGVCGFVRRDSLPAPDIGFAFLPKHEGKGYGFESANALLGFGRETLNFTEVLAITTLDNNVSGKLLEKLGFVLQEITEMPDGERLKLFRIDLSMESHGNKNKMNAENSSR
ncbi:MAG: GNAT family N-acetyltransferase [Pyrinomonadaceae bacterium]